MIRRRRFLSGLAATAVLGRWVAAPAVAASANKVVTGAIRWDAWESTGSVNAAVVATLGPAQYHARAPFCAQPLSADSISFAGCDRQAVMDAEIGYAARAGLSYWAYVWYEMNDSMMNAWKLHQASAVRDRMNWCVLMQFGRINDGPWLLPQIPTYVEYFRQSNYQKVMGNRPLLYVYMYNYKMNGGSTPEQWAAVHDAFASLGAACEGAGLGRPYMVIMDGVPWQAAQLMKLMGGDAISNYVACWPSHTPESYPAYDLEIRKFWATMAATGVPIVPICMTGWDPRPRISQQLKTQPQLKSKVSMSYYVVPGTPAEIAENIKAGLDYVRSTPAACPANAVLIYSWDECDEGGSALIPSYSESGPNASIVYALQSSVRN